ncbi:thioredoxin fold domain-containing protein [Vibrio splendidus]|nr:thioredoxin fold domain-containing protein [Vibrio splendidus]MCC4883294.1 thioredoxin fold domain-containing protein [Vibrio splendidus]
MKRTLLALSLSLIASSSIASSFVSDEIVKTTAATLTGLESDHVVYAQEDKDIGMNVIRLVTGQVIYGDKDGKFFINGGSYTNSSVIMKDSKTGMLENHTETLFNDLHKDIFSKIEGSGVIVKAPNEKLKIQVFYEPRCGYCKKLHKEEQSYLDAGISIEYIPYPIYDGERSYSSKSLAYIVSGENQEERNKRMKTMLAAFDADPKNPDIEKLVKDVDTSILLKHKKEISSLAIQGTPYILLENGQAIPGYAPPANILAAAAAGK